MIKVTLSLAFASLFISNVYASLADLADQSQTLNSPKKLSPDEQCDKIEYNALDYSRGGYNLYVFPCVSHDLKYQALMVEARKAFKIQGDRVHVIGVSKDHSDTHSSKEFIFECVKRSLKHALEMVVLEGVRLENLDDSYGILGYLPFYIKEMSEFSELNVSSDLSDPWGYIIETLININDILLKMKAVLDTFKTYQLDAERINLHEKFSIEKQSPFNDLTQMRIDTAFLLNPYFRQFEDAKTKYYIGL